MLIKKRIPIFGLYIARKQSASPVVLYFRTKADAESYQKFHYNNTQSEIKELDAIDVDGEIKHFHYRASAANHGFGAYILHDDLRMEIMRQNEWVLVGLNRPHPNKRIAGSPKTMKEARHFIWAGKVKNELVIKDAKLLMKSIVFADQRSLRLRT